MRGALHPANASPHQATTTFRHVWFLWTAFQGGERMHINNTPCRITTVVAVSAICLHAASNVLTTSGCQALCNMQTIFLTSCPSIGYKTYRSTYPLLPNLLPMMLCAVQPYSEWSLLCSVVYGIQERPLDSNKWRGPASRQINRLARSF